VIPMRHRPKTIIILMALCWTALSLTWHWFRSRFLLKKWAKEHGFELVRMDQKKLYLSPFPFPSKHQEIFHIRVRDNKGRERTGWAKCGGFWLGFLVDKIEVEWN
jgi:hypothetical protein